MEAEVKKLINRYLHTAGERVLFLKMAGLGHVAPNVMIDLSCREFAKEMLRLATNGVYSLSDLHNGLKTLDS